MAILNIQLLVFGGVILSSCEYHGLPNPAAQWVWMQLESMGNFPQKTWQFLRDFARKNAKQKPTEEVIGTGDFEPSFFWRWESL